MYCLYLWQYKKEKNKEKGITLDVSGGFVAIMHVYVIYTLPDFLHNWPMKPLKEPPNQEHNK